MEALSCIGFTLHDHAYCDLARVVSVTSDTVVDPL